MWTLSIESLGPWPLLRLSGHLVQGLPAEALTAAVRDLIAQGRLNIVCVATDVGVIDSTGTGVLVAVRDTTHRAGDTGYRRRPPPDSYSQPSLFHS